MKKLTLCLLFAVLASSMSSCATTHLWRWGLGKTSAIHTVDDDEIAAYLKPVCTVFGTPVSAAWDLVTLPFQLGFQVYPYFGSHLMAPSERGE